MMCLRYNKKISLGHRVGKAPDSIEGGMWVNNIPGIPGIPERRNSTDEGQWWKDHGKKAS